MADSQRKTANLLNNNPATQGDGYVNGAILQQDGTLNTIATSFWVTEYIPITEGTYYYYNDLHRSTSSYINFYDNAKTNIGSVLQKAAMTQESFNLTALVLPTGTGYIRMNIDKQSTQNCLYTSQLPSYEPYGWLHSLRKLTTATEAVENPLYSDGTAITSYTIKGNTVQSGTPTPSNPVDVNGVGVRTENLFNTFDIVGQVPSTGNGALVSHNGSTTSFIPINSGNVVVTKPENILIYLMLYAANGDYIGYDIANAGTTINGSNISGYENAKLARLRIDRTSGLDDIQIMFNSGSTAKPYEPYGYKIPISSAGQTIDIYIGDLPLLKSLDGTAVDEINNGTLTRRVDSDGSVLPTPTTTQITMPSIPTTEGANSITVDTTVQPSEFTATWTGWHDSSVQEYAGGVGNNKFDEQYPDISDTIIYKPIYVGDGNFTLSTTAPQTSDPAALLFLLSGNVSSGASSSANGVWSGQNRTKAAVDGYVTVAYRAIRDYTPVGSQTMLNAGTTAMTYEPYEYGWV